MFFLQDYCIQYTISDPKNKRCRLRDKKNNLNVFTAGVILREAFFQDSERAFLRGCNFPVKSSTQSLETKIITSFFLKILV